VQLSSFLLTTLPHWSQIFSINTIQIGDLMVAVSAVRGYAALTAGAALNTSHQGAALSSTKERNFDERRPILMYQYSRSGAF
jgi:hypothetical protein